MRVGHLSAFYQRIIEWDYPDIPARAPVYSSDRPLKAKPLPRFLDDGAAAKFLTAARNLPDEFGRLAIEMLSRTGMRKGALLDQTPNSAGQLGSAYSPRIPSAHLPHTR